MNEDHLDLAGELVSGCFGYSEQARSNCRYFATVIFWTRSGRHGLNVMNNGIMSFLDPLDIKVFCDMRYNVIEWLDDAQPEHDMPEVATN
jgi:hypothetical protein